MAERKQKPCEKCGNEDHGYLNKASKRSCPKDDDRLPGELREIWVQHELNPHNEDATVEARIAAANAANEAAGQPQAQTLPIALCQEHKLPSDRANPPHPSMPHTVVLIAPNESSQKNEFRAQMSPQVGPIHPQGFASLTKERFLYHPTGKLSTRMKGTGKQRKREIR